MDLALTPEQEMLVRAVRGVLSRRHVAADEMDERDARGHAAAVWHELAELGWLGIDLPAAYGGGELGFVEVVLLLEEMGRVLLPVPFIATVVIAAALIRALGDEAEQQQWLTAIASGKCVASLALAEPGWRDPYGTPTVQVDSNGRLSGTKTFVSFAAAADLLLVAAEGPSLVMVERDAAGIECERLATLGGDPLYEVRFSGAHSVPLGPRAGAGRALAHALDRGAIATLAWMTGAAEHALEMSVAHAGTRVQFGRPIGSFQAVAHRCVDMRSDIDALRFLVYQAAWALASDGAAELSVAAAQAYGGPALRRIFMHAHQVHGAIGFSTEHQLHRFTCHAKAAELAWGDDTSHYERVARAMGVG